MRVPQQRVGGFTGAGVGHAQAAAQQQAFTLDPIGFAQGLDYQFGDLLHPCRIAAGVQQQGELVAAQAGDVVAVVQVRLQPCHHLQDQAVAGLVAEGVVDVAEVVQVQVAQRQAAPFALAQPGGEQGLETLAVGDAGQRVLLGQALQGVLQRSALAHIAQGTAQDFDTEGLGHQVVGDADGFFRGLALQQQDQRQVALVGGRQLGGRGEHQADLILVEQALAACQDGAVISE